MKNSGKNSFLSWLNILGQLVIASIVWVVCSLPVVTLGASSCALYYAVVKALRRDRGSLLPCFFSAFKNNFGQCLMVNMLYLTLFAIPAYFAIPHLLSIEQGLSGSFYVIVGIVFLLALPLSVTYPVISRFYHKGGQLVRFLLMITGRHPMVCISSVLMLAAGIVIVMSNAASLIFVPGIIAYVQALMLENVFEKYSSGDEREVWYD